MKIKILILTILLILSSSCARSTSQFTVVPGTHLPKKAITGIVVYATMPSYTARVNIEDSFVKLGEHYSIPIKASYVLAPKLNGKAVRQFRKMGINGILFLSLANQKNLPYAIRSTTRPTSYTDQSGRIHTTYHTTARQTHIPRQTYFVGLFELSRKRQQQKSAQLWAAEAWAKGNELADFEDLQNRIAEDTLKNLAKAGLIKLIQKK